MPDTSIKVAIALFMVLTPPTVSFARGGGGHGGGHAGFSAMAAFSRPAGSAGSGNVPISGIPRGPANVGGLHNTTVDPSGIRDGARMATLPQPNIAASTLPQPNMAAPMLPGGSRIPGALPPMTAEPSTLEEASGTHLQPRVGQAPSEKDLTDPNSPANRENAALDRMLDICRGC
jgi:hypothetical protein